MFYRFILQCKGTYFFLKAPQKIDKKQMESFQLEVRLSFYIVCLYSIRR